VRLLVAKLKELLVMVGIKLNNLSKRRNISQNKTWNKPFLLHHWKLPVISAVQTSPPPPPNICDDAGVSPKLHCHCVQTTVDVA
jgi:hypothetical protein